MYVLPTFNLVCSIWRNEDNHAWPWPLTNPATYVNVPANLSYSRRTATGFDAGPWCLIPKGYVLYDTATVGLGPGNSWIECPQGSGRFYAVSWAHNVAVGFPNEHIAAWLVKASLFGTN